MKRILISLLFVLLVVQGVSALSTEIGYFGFESGEQGWIDGGADSSRDNTRSNVTDTGAPGGTWSWTLQDDSESSYTEQAFDFTGYDNVTMTWAAYYNSIEGSEALELRCDGTVLWHYEANTEGTEFDWIGPEAGQRVTIYPANCTFDSSVTIRFEAEFSHNGDDVWIDGINITGYNISIAAPSDDEYPQFSSFDEVPANNTAYSFGAKYEFNVTISSTNGTAGIEFYGVNYSSSNVSDEFNFSILDLAAGTYNYYWWAFGNGTDNNYNTSNLRSYSVARAVPEGSLTNTDPWTVEYSEEVTIGLSESNVGDGDVSYVVYRDDVSVGTGETITLGAGSYSYLLNTTGGQNYTENSSMDSQTLTVNQNSSYVLSLSLSPSDSESFGTETTATGSGCPSQLTCTLFRDGVAVSNPEIVTLGVGTYNYTYNTTGNTNYTVKSTSDILTISQITSEVNLTLNGTEGNITIEQGSSILLNGTLITGDSGGTLELYNNGTLINSGTNEVSNLTTFSDLGLLNITVRYVSSQNYSVSSETYWVNVTEVLDMTPPHVEIVYPQDANYTFVQTELNYTVSDVNLQACWYSTDEGATNTTINCGVNVSGLNSGQGSSTWTAYANDSSGNENSSSVTFFVDSLNPEIVYGVGTENNGSIFARDYVYVNVSVIETNEANITFSLWNDTNVLNVSTFTNSQREINWTNFSDGTYYYNVSVFDTFGNWNTTENRVIILDNGVPMITIHNPQEVTYTNNSILINVTSNGASTWFFNGSENESYSGEVYRDFPEGGSTLVVYANNSAGTEVSSSVSFSVNTLVMSCEVGGPYQQGALVLVQGNLSNVSGVINGYDVNVSVYENSLLNDSKIVTTSSDGSYETSFINLSVGNFVLNVTANVDGLNQSCLDSFEIGSAAGFVLDKIGTIHNVSDDVIIYNITLRLTNNGGADALTSNISDGDSSDSPYLLGTVSPGTNVLRSYLLNLTRENSTTYHLSPVASSLGMDAFANSLISANSSSLNLTIPDKSIGNQIVITKNVLYLSEENLNVTYNVSATLYNSGDEDLQSISYVDTDINSVAIFLNLTKGSSQGYSSLVVIDKAASNTVHQFALGTATVSAEVFYSNRPSVSIPGYGGPADATVYAPTSVETSTSFNPIIEVKNANEDIGQDFIVDYWITNVAETINYTSGQQTVFVSANGSTNVSTSLTSPSTAGIYRLRALVTWVGGTATSFDSFEVTSVGGESEGGSGGGGGTPGGEPEEEVEEEPEEEAPEVVIPDREPEEEVEEEPEEEAPEEPEEPEEPRRGITGLFIEGEEGSRTLSFYGWLFIGIFILLILIWIIRQLIGGKKKGRKKGRLKHVRGMKVYAGDGTEIGKVKEIYIKEYRIDSLSIKLNKKKKFKAKGIVLKYKNVESIKDIVIVEEEVLSEVEK